MQTYLFYDNIEIRDADFSINNKMISKQLFIRALNSLNEFYLNIYMIFLEDRLMNFILYKTGLLFRKIWLLLKKNTIGICKNIFKLNQMKIKSYFIYLKLIFENSKSIKYEKDMANHQLTLIGKYENIEKELSSSSFNNDFYFYYEIINMLLNWEFISEKNKLILLKYKKIIEIKNKTFVNPKKIYIRK